MRCHWLTDSWQGDSSCQAIHLGLLLETAVIVGFSDLFSKRVWPLVQGLLTGAILAVGPRTPPGNRRGSGTATDSGVVYPPLADRGHVRRSMRPSGSGNAMLMVGARHRTHHAGDSGAVLDRDAGGEVLVKIPRALFDRPTEAVSYAV